MVGGRIDGATVVLADVNDYREFSRPHPRLSRLDLGPLPRDAVQVYLVKKRKLVNPEVVEAICKSCLGRPDIMAMSADVHEALARHGNAQA